MASEAKTWNNRSDYTTGVDTYRCSALIPLMTLVAVNGVPIGVTCSSGYLP